MLSATRIGLSILAATALGSAALAISCSYYPYDCADYAECGPPDKEACPGQCVPLAPLDFDGPTLLWVGRQTESPGCPDRAPQKVYVGFAELDTSNDCAPCECTAPACELPSGVTASTLSVCPNDGPGATLTPFEAPDEWDGTCTSPPAIPASLVGSLTVAPVTVVPCQPVQEVPASSSATWGKIAYACAGEAIPNVCPNPGETCLPSAEPPPPGFQQCVLYLRDGEPQCPANYPEKHVVYGGADDTRGCTECKCTETVASNCAAAVSTYQDTDCGTFVVGGMVADVPICLDVSPGVALGSMDAMWLNHEPGTCIAGGGEAVGEVKPVEPRTFCCQPPPG